MRIIKTRWRSGATQALSCGPGPELEARLREDVGLAAGYLGDVALARTELDRALEHHRGTGDARAQDDGKLLWVGRIWFDPSEYRLTEGAPEMPENNLVHVGLAVRTGEIVRRGQPGIFESPNNQTAWNLEAAWKYNRWSATGEYFRESTEIDNPTVGSDIDADGWHVQGGVIVMPKTVELGLRYAVVDPDLAAAVNSKKETHFVANWYAKGHMIKTQFELGQIQYDSTNPDIGPRLGTGGAVTDRQLRVQLQLSF